MTVFRFMVRVRPFVVTLGEHNFLVVDWKKPDG